MGALLKSLRLRAGMSVAEVAASVGRSAAFLYTIESGAKEPDKGTMKALCRVLGATQGEVIELALLRALGSRSVAEAIPDAPFARIA